MMMMISSQRFSGSGRKDNCLVVLMACWEVAGMPETHNPEAGARLYGRPGAPAVHH